MQSGDVGELVTERGSRSAATTFVNGSPRSLLVLAGRLAETCARDGGRESDEKTGAVVRHDRHPFAASDAEGIEAGGHRSGVFGDLPPRQRSPARGGLVGFVDDPDAVAVDLLGAVEEVEDVERDVHDSSPGRPVTPPFVRSTNRRVRGRVRLRRADCQTAAERPM
jgi:hypothetical protein